MLDASDPPNWRASLVGPWNWHVLPDSPQNRHELLDCPRKWHLRWRITVREYSILCCELTSEFRLSGLMTFGMGMRCPMMAFRVSTCRPTIDGVGVRRIIMGACCLVTPRNSAYVDAFML